MQQHSGFTVELEPAVLADPALARLSLYVVTSGLASARRMLGDAKTDQLVGVRIRLVAKSTSFDGPAAYHPFHSGAVGPEHHNTIEVNLSRYIEAVQHHQPSAMLHELVHAYEFLVLGQENPALIAAFERARDSGRYDRVARLYAPAPERAYAMTDHHEFLAEAVESYFGVNDFYPYVAAQLHEHDLATYAYVQSIFGPPRGGESAPLQACGAATATTYTGAASTLRFVNLGTRGVVLGWLDPAGAFVASTTIAPNAAASMNTFGGHWFELRDAETHGCVALAQAVERPADAIIR